MDDESLGFTFIYLSGGYIVGDLVTKFHKNTITINGMSKVT